MSRQKPFYLVPRKSSGIYYYIVRDPVSRKTVAYKSTETTDKKLAEATAMDWWANGLPGKSNGLARKMIFCDYLHHTVTIINSGWVQVVEKVPKK